MRRRKIGRPRRRFWIGFDHVDETITFDVVGDTLFASVGGRRFAASQLKNWRWVGLTGGRHAALLHALNNKERAVRTPRPRSALSGRF